MELVFRILAVILIGIAAYFLWRKNGETAFISAALGAVSFFLSLRFQVKERLEKEEETRRTGEEEITKSALLSDKYNPISSEQPAMNDEEKANL